MEIVMDTHKIFKNLTTADLTEKQAEAIVESIKISRESLVTLDTLETSQSKQTTKIVLWVAGIMGLLFTALQMWPPEYNSVNVETAKSDVVEYHERVDEGVSE